MKQRKHQQAIAVTHTTMLGNTPISIDFAAGTFSMAVSGRMCQPNTQEGHQRDLDAEVRSEANQVAAWQQRLREGHLRDRIDAVTALIPAYFRWCLWSQEWDFDETPGRITFRLRDLERFSCT